MTALYRYPSNFFESFHPGNTNTYFGLRNTTERMESTDGLGDGYVSDVPTLASQSEFSLDLLSTTRHIEKQFKDKYRVLRSTYEQRIRSLSDILTDTCAGLFTDDLLEEMKGDKLSVSFIPAHLSEVIERQLENERENFIHAMANKMSQLEVELIKYQSICKNQNIKISNMESSVEKSKQTEISMTQLQEKLSNTEFMYSKLKTESQASIDSLCKKIESLQTYDSEQKSLIDTMNRALEQSKTEYEELHDLYGTKSKEITVFEQSMERSHREIVTLENMEKEERSRGKELREQLITSSREKEKILIELNDTKSNLRLKSEECDHLQSVILLKNEEEKLNREKVDLLMRQVEGMLAQEAHESNTVIVTMHDKMKLFKSRMSNELMREKKIILSLQEEITMLRNVREDKTRDLLSMSEDSKSLKERIVTEKKKYDELFGQHQESNLQLNTLRNSIMDLQHKLNHAQDRVRELEKAKTEDEVRHSKTLATYNEREKTLLHQVEAINTSASLDPRNNVMPIDNMQKGGNTLRHSYTFGSGEFNHNSLTVHQLRDRLKEALSNLEKIKIIAREYKTAYEKQNITINQLNHKTRSLEDEIVHYKMLHSNGKSTSLASHYEIDQLKSEILEKNKEVQNLLSSNERFSREIDNLNNQLLSVKTNKLDFIDDKTEEIHRLVKFNKHLEKENEKLNKQLIAVNEEKENVMKELAADGRQLSEMQKKFELLMKSFENLQTNSVTKDQVNKINASMKSTNESLKNEIEQLRNSETKLKQTIYIVVEKFRRLKRSMIDLSKDIHNELSNESLAIYNKLETLLRVVNEPNISSSNDYINDEVSLTLEKKPLDLLQNYESVLRGILFSCTSANILSDNSVYSLLALLDVSSQIDELKINITPSVYDTTIQIFSNDLLARHPTEYNDVNHKKIPKNCLDSHDDIDIGDQLSTISSDTINTQRTLEATLKELEQVKQNQAIINELSVLENQSKITALEEYISDLNKKHSIELRNAIDSYNLMESTLLKKIMDNEISSKSEELDRSASIMSKYKAEQNKTKLLKARLEEVEANFESISQQFSDANKKTLQIEQELIQLKYK